jgi:hypothetical protein
MTRFYLKIFIAIIFIHLKNLGFSQENSIHFTEPEIHTENIKNLAKCNEFYFAGSDQGLYASSDKGKTWNLSEGFIKNGVKKIIVEDDFVYVLTESEGLFVSPDCGKTWESLKIPFKKYKILLMNDFAVIRKTLIVSLNYNNPTFITMAKLI